MDNTTIWPPAVMQTHHENEAEIEMPAVGLGVFHETNQDAQIPQIIPPQPDLYLQLAQILEWEIWNHNKTRSELQAQIARYNELESQVWKQSQDMTQLQNACQTVYASLDQHRSEATRLKQELEAVTAELTSLKEVCLASCHTRTYHFALTKTAGTSHAVSRS